jgi:lipopolysaccharide export system permease protein
MRLIEKYLFRQLLWPTIATATALGAVALLSQTLAEIDVLVNQHQSVKVFLTLIALSLPEMLVMVLPIALFVAALMSLNRLHTEQEIVVCYAGGLSRWRVVAPGIRLATLCALITLVMNLWIVPWCYRERTQELFKIKTDLVSSLVRDGQFTQPAPGLTVYAQSTDRNGELHNVFIDEEKPGGQSTSFTSKFGHIVKRGDQPALIMRIGSNQHFDAQGVLQYVTFDEYVFDLTPYINTDEDVHFKSSDRYLHELLFPDLTQPLDKHDRKKFLAEANERLSSPLYNLALMTLALTGVLGGPFSRTGYGRRIATVCSVAAFIRILGFGAQAVCEAAPVLNIIQYVIPLLPMAIALRQVLGPLPSRAVKLQGLTELQPITAA